MSKRIFITGGTGLIGSALVEALRGRGDQVIVLTRDPDKARRVFGSEREGVELVEGDPAFAGPWQRHLADVHAVVNLAGASIAGKRWDSRYKQILRDSRVEGTRCVVEGIAALYVGKPAGEPAGESAGEPAGEAQAVGADAGAGAGARGRPTVLVSASGVDYYPFDVDLATAMDEDDEITESAPPGSSFLARVCRSWEEEAVAAEPLGVRVVRMRTGLVLGHGGAFDRMALPFRLFAGGPIGSGRQWVSWVHIDDVVRAYLFALDEDTLRGPVNLVAPGAVRAKPFARALGHALRRPSWLPVPGFAVKAAVGELAEYVLHGRRAVPAALQAHGFAFHYPEVEAALLDIAQGE